MKEDVETLEAKQEMIIQVELTSEQKRLYRAVYEKNVSQIAKLAGAKNGEGQLKNIAMQLRKCCNHPFLINGIEDTTNAAAIANAARDPNNPFRSYRAEDTPMAVTAGLRGDADESRRSRESR